MKTDVLYDGCGVSKTCFGFPDKCVSSASCQMAVAVSVKGDRYEFEMKAQGAKWVGVGLSNDHLMVYLLLFYLFFFSSRMLYKTVFSLQYAFYYLSSSL